MTNFINSNPTSVVLFGASRGAQYTIRVLQHLNIKIDCIVESDSLTSDNLYAPKKVNNVLGIDVLSISSGFQRYPNAKVLITTMDSKNLLPITSMLEKAGWSDIDWIMPDIILHYLKLFSSRSLDLDKFQKNKLQLFNKTSRQTTYSISPSITILVTEKCNLNCDHCAAFVPLNSNPETFSVDSIYQSVKNYCDSFDFVYRICVMGGEPFIHKDIIHILDRLSTIPNLLFIDIATNGTVVPNSKTLDAVKRAGSCIEVSDYGIASRKMEQLFSDCSDKGILYYHQKYAFWGNLGDIKHYHRSASQLHSYYIDCIQGPGITNHIIDGVLYRCLTSGMAAKLSLYPRENTDFVDLLSPDISSSELNTKIKELTFRSTPLQACNYCSNGVFQVPAGAQIIRPII